MWLSTRVDIAAGQDMEGNNGTLNNPSLMSANSSRAKCCIVMSNTDTQTYSGRRPVTDHISLTSVALKRPKFGSTHTARMQPSSVHHATATSSLDGRREVDCSSPVHEGRGKARERETTAARWECQHDWTLQTGWAAQAQATSGPLHKVHTGDVNKRQGTW